MRTFHSAHWSHCYKRFLMQASSSQFICSARLGLLTAGYECTQPYLNIPSLHFNTVTIFFLPKHFPLPSQTFVTGVVSFNCNTLCAYLTNFEPQKLHQVCQFYCNECQKRMCWKPFPFAMQLQHLLQARKDFAILATLSPIVARSNTTGNPQKFKNFDQKAEVCNFECFTQYKSISVWQQA